MPDNTNAISPIISGSYAPCILYGSANWDPLKGDEQNINQNLPSYAILSVREGRHVIRSPGRKWDLKRGSAILLSPSTPYIHTKSTHSLVNYIVFNITHSPLEASGDINNTYILKMKQPLTPQPPPSLIWGQHAVEQIPDQISHIVEREVEACCDNWWRRPLDRFNANHHLHKILNLLTNHFWSSNRDASRPSVAPELIQSALAQITGRPPPRTVEQWAFSVGLQRNHFSNLFRETLGITPAVYLRRARLKRAEELLYRTEESLGFIAQQAGYSSVSAMSQAFSANHKITPSNWRRQSRQ